MATYDDRRAYLYKRRAVQSNKKMDNLLISLMSFYPILKLTKVLKSKPEYFLNDPTNFYIIPPARFETLFLSNGRLSVL